MNYLKVLGASGSKTKLTGTTSFQIYNDILVDAGNVINTLGEDAKFINHIFLTHSHSDHIIDLPFIVESFFEQRTETLIVYGSKETLDSLQAHTFNNEIWPDFTKINLPNSNKKSLILKVIELNDTINIGSYNITAINAKHIKGSYGFTIIKDKLNGYVISGDTYENKELMEIVNNNNKIKSLIIECSFPSNMKTIANDSKHLTPEILKNQLKYLTRDNIQIFIYHLKPLYREQMIKEIKDLEILSKGGKVLEEGDVIHIETGEIETDMMSHNKFERIMQINQELSSEVDKNRLFEMILTLTRELTHCEAGTLYIISKDKKNLEFKVVQNDPMNIHMGGTKDNLTWKSLPLYVKNGYKNENIVAVMAALENKIINIKDVYNSRLYSFDGTKRFDKNIGYKSKTMLVIPLINHENDVIGVLQLINKTKVPNEVVSFDEKDETIIKALARHAAMALTNTQLIENLEEFINAFVLTISKEIDAKSKYKIDHIRNVEKLSKLISTEIHEDTTTYKDVQYTKNDFMQIELASLIHDIGKISIPESILDKGTKLESIVDRIEIIQSKFEIIKRDLEILLLKEVITKEDYLDSISQIKDDFEFIKESNIGSEFMDDNKIHRIKLISEYTYLLNGKKTPILNAKELSSLIIKKGTLSDEEKDIMNCHEKLSLDMLNTLPFPKKYNKILDIATKHHKTLNNKDLTLENRIMVLADIFEALTARDRPDKEGKKLSEVFDILSIMAKNNEIDSELLKFFHDSKALSTYAKKELKHMQIDESNLNL